MPGSMKSLLERLVALERFSEHPVAKALLECAASQGIGVATSGAKDFENRPGYGVRAVVGGRTILAGNDAWMDANHVVREPRLGQRALGLDEAGVGWRTESGTMRLH